MLILIDSRVETKPMVSSTLVYERFCRDVIRIVFGQALAVIAS